jgi:hypothetical protein
VSRHTYDDLRKALRQSQAIIYSVFIEVSVLDSITELGRGILREITSNSGGVALSAFDNTAVPGALEVIAEELHHQYTIGFKPTTWTASGTLSRSNWNQTRLKTHQTPAGLAK